MKKGSQLGVDVNLQDSDNVRVPRQLKASPRASAADPNKPHRDLLRSIPGFMFHVSGPIIHGSVLAL